MHSPVSRRNDFVTLAIWMEKLKREIERVEWEEAHGLANPVEETR